MEDKGILKVGLVGCGRVAALHHMPVYNQLRAVQVTAVSDVNIKAREAFAKSFKIGKSFQDLTEMLSQEDFDLVDICTPPVTHYSLAMEAIERGFNVLVEKPAALEYDDLIKLRDASSRGKAKVCIVQNYRFLHSVAKLMQAIREMRLGPIRGVTALSHESHQRSEKDLDFLYETAVHVVDLQSLILGKMKKVRDVFTTKSPHTGRILSVLCLVEYERGGGIIDAGEGFGSDIVGLDVSGSKRDAALRFHPESLAFLRSSGVPFQVLKGEMVSLARFAFSKAIPGRHYYASYHRDLIRNYVGSILDNSEPPVTIEDVMNTMKVLQDIKTEALH
jgi:predicted dehydrogenase